MSLFEHRQMVKANCKMQNFSEFERRVRILLGSGCTVTDNGDPLDDYFEQGIQVSEVPIFYHYKAVGAGTVILCNKNDGCWYIFRDLSDVHGSASETLLSEGEDLSIAWDNYQNKVTAKSKMDLM